MRPSEENKFQQDSRLRGTRGDIIRILRGGEYTVKDLAAALQLSGNAVRAHLAVLDREHLLESRSVRRGGGKPSLLYSLSPSGHGLFPAAHGSVLAAFLAEVRDRLPAEQSRDFLRAVGQRIARPRSARGKPYRVRMEAAARALEDLGALARVDKTPSGHAIVAPFCPLADVAIEYPEVCTLANSILSEVAGVEFQTECTGKPHPACRFQSRSRKSRGDDRQLKSD